MTCQNLEQRSCYAVFMDTPSRRSDTNRPVGVGEGRRPDTNRPVGVGEGRRPNTNKPVGMGGPKARYQQASGGGRAEGPIPSSQ